MKNKKVEIPENALIILVGVAGSGKSTMAKNTFPKAIHVSSDTCRAIVSPIHSEEDQSVNAEAFDLFYQKIGEGLKEKKQVIADATNLEKTSRERLYQIAKENGAPVYAVIFNIPLEVALRQNASRSRKVPEPIIKAQFIKFQKAYEDINNELPKEHIIDVVFTKEKENQER